MIARTLASIDVEGLMATLPLMLPAYGHRSAQDSVSGRRHLHAQGWECILSGPANPFDASCMSVAKAHAIRCMSKWVTQQVRSMLCPGQLRRDLRGWIGTPSPIGKLAPCSENLTISYHFPKLSWLLSPVQPFLEDQHLERALL